MLGALNLSIGLLTQDKGGLIARGPAAPMGGSVGYPGSAAAARPWPGVRAAPVWPRLTTDLPHHQIGRKAPQADDRSTEKNPVSTGEKPPKHIKSLQ